MLAKQYARLVSDDVQRFRECAKKAEARAERLAVLLAAVTEIAARNEDSECIREARRALEADK